jgi:hypothetical protein
MINTDDKHVRPIPFFQTFNCIPETRHYQNVELLTQLRAKIECQQPITDLYKFVGRISLYDSSGGEPLVRPLSAENVLLRGAMLKNTPFIFGKFTNTVNPQIFACLLFLRLANFGKLKGRQIPNLIEITVMQSSKRYTNCTLKLQFLQNAKFNGCENLGVYSNQCQLSGSVPFMLT